MDNLLKRLTRKIVYGTASVLVIFLVVLLSFVEDWRNEIYHLIFNPVWPIALGLLEFVLQENEKEIAAENQRKLDSLNGVLRRSINNPSEQEIIEAIIDAVGTDNLMAINIDKISQKKLQERLTETKVEQETPENLTP